MDKVLVLDPGNSTGWLFRDSDGKLYGGTIFEDHLKVAELIETKHADIIIYETFQLYPNKAQKMCWSSFYPVEVIGIIKYLALKNNIQLVGLQPSVKKFVGKLNWSDINGVCTEHTRDTYRLYDFWHRNYEKSSK